MAKKRAVRKVTLNKVSKQNLSNTPTGVKIISILFYVSAVFSILGGLLLAIGGSYLVNSGVGQETIDSIAGQVGATQMINSGSLTALFIGFGIAFILFGLIDGLVARGLWKGKNWARIVTIIFGVLYILNSIGEVATGRIFSGIVDLIICLSIVLYLSFSKEVQSVFS